MSPTPTAEYDEVLARVRTWPPEQRLHLTEDLLRSLPHTRGPDGLRGVPVEKVRGVAAGAGPAPDDDTVRRWVQEHQAEKYGMKVLLDTSVVLDLSLNRSPWAVDMAEVWNAHRRGQIEAFLAAFAVPIAETRDSAFSVSR